MSNPLDSQQELTASRICCWLTLTLVPIHGYLDYITYPAFISEFMILRGGLMLIAFLCLLHSYVSKHRLPRIYLFFLCESIAFVFSLMCNISLEGYKSDYYIGILLVMMAFIMIPFPSSIYLLTLLFMYLTYVCTLHFIHPVYFEFRYFVENHFFIVDTIIILICAHFYILSLRNRLNETNQQNQYFVNVFTHDIKNKMFALNYRLRSGGKKTSEEEAFVDGILQISENVFRVSANLINVFSKEKVVLNKKPVQVSSILSSIQEKWESLFVDKGISFSIHSKVSSSVIVDLEYMDLVFENLLSNAFEHTTPSGFFQLECAEQDSKIQFSFRNSVSSRNELPDVFKKYSCPEQQNPYNKGLGLHYSKMMVEMHKGTIEYRRLESGVGEFLVILDSFSETLSVPK